MPIKESQIKELKLAKKLLGECANKHKQEAQKNKVLLADKTWMTAKGL